MALIAIKAFGGMQPAIDDRLLPQSNAATAENTWLYDGKLRGVRTPRLLVELDDPDTRFVYRIPKQATGVSNLPDSYWMEFAAANTSVVKSPITNAEPLFYYCDGLDEPRYTSRQLFIDGDPDYILGIPAPSGTITVAPAGGVSGTTESRAYVYTHVSSFGEEGPPSDPSAVTTGKIDDTWALTIPAVGGDATDRDITHTRIYRTITSDQGISTYFFVAEVTVATLAYNDTTTSDVVALNEELTSQEYDPPPTDLEGFVAMPNGMLIGWVDNEIWFSEPYRPHAWPASYQVSVDFDIVGIGVVGQTAVICTEGTPYTCTGSHPSQIALTRIVGESCISQGSVVSTPEGVYYGSPSGLALIGPGAAKTVTAGLVSKERWQTLLNMANLNAAMLASAYVTFSGTNLGCFEETAFEETAFEFTDFTGTRDGALIDLNDARVGFNVLTSEDPIYNVLKDPWTNEVLIIRDGAVYQLDTTSRQSHGEYFWRSKIFQMDKPTNLGCGKIYWEMPDDVEFPGTSLQVYGDGELIYTVDVPASGEMFRLPAGRRYDFYQFELEGDLLITAMHFATTPKELRAQ